MEGRRGVVAGERELLDEGRGRGMTEVEVERGGCMSFIAYNVYTYTCSVHYQQNAT